MSRYLVTGASGHIGNTLVRELLARGENVTAVVHNPNSPALADIDVPVVAGNIADPSFAESVILKDDVVIHSAGLIAITQADRDRVFETNLGGARAVAAACVKNGASMLVYVSSVDIITDRSPEVITEPHTFDTDMLKGNYAASKAMATAQLLEMAENGSLDVRVVYPSAVIGPNDFKISAVGQVIDDFINHMPMARVNGGYNFVDVRDVADGIIRTALYGRSGEGYLLTGEYCTVDDLFRILGEKYGRHMPMKLSVGFVSAFTEIVVLYYKVRGKKPVFSRYALKTLNSNSNYSCEKAEKELGYTHRSARESILDSAEWFARCGKQKKKAERRKKQ